MTSTRLTSTANGQTCVPFDNLDDNTTQLWIAKAQYTIGKLGFTYDDFDYAELVYSTAVYLYNIDHLLKPILAYPHYVVHSQDDDSRFVTASFEMAMSHFKRL